MKALRNRFLIITLFLANTIVYDLMALTSGPTQPETQQFTPIGASDMVDLFSGNFMYNIPLFELPGPNGGYPFNIGYRSGITMDQEATWVGLGWNLQVGSINRQMRTLPDEFNGTEQIIKVNDQLDNKTVGVGMKFSTELGGKDNDEVASLSPSYGVTMYFNSYKGFGFATDIGVGVSFGVKDNGVGGIGVSVKNDNQEGATFSPNISLGFSKRHNDAKVGGSLNLGLNYNSNMGLQNISLGAGMSVSNKKESHIDDTGPSDKKSKTSAGVSGGAVMSFNNAFITSPSIRNATKTSTFQGAFKFGTAAAFGQFAGELSGTYSNEMLIDKMNPIPHRAYGYLNLQKGQDDNNAALDFIREKDGMLHKEMRNLAAPVLTYDIYSVSGHGFSGMFRPYRSDIGVVQDRDVYSYSDGLNVSADGSVGNLFQVGFSMNFPTTSNNSGRWNGTDEDIYKRCNFTEESDNSLHEPYRFQVYGEKNVYDKNEISNLIGGFEPSFIGISGATHSDEIDYTTTGYRNGNTKKDQFINTNQMSNRAPRQTDIKAIENKYLYDESLLPECMAYFINSSGQLDTLDRTPSGGLNLEHHIGAFIVTTTDGTRYIYSLPVYNKKQVECSFSTYFGNKEGDISAKNFNDKIPDEYFHIAGNFVEHNTPDIENNEKNYGYENFDRTEIPAYVYTWLLTAIIGPDYVDMNEDGVTDDDLGYFVKFIYKKTGDYQWRAPFNTANYIEGQYALGADNMGTYNYGVRETYYLYRAETKSHQALFYTSPREDGRGVSTEFQKSESVFGAQSYKLDSIQLFSKLESTQPIKSIYLKYNGYDLNPASRFWVNSTNESKELCVGVDNAPQGRGKLTLKAIYSTYGSNEKGLNNPYIFNYHEDEEDENPNYHPFKYDRWGNYQQYWADASMNPIKYFPYTRQDVREGLDIETKNKWASVWNLKEVVLPSGAKIVVDYEADRYAYVQNKPTMEMYKIEGINSNTEVLHYPYSLGTYIDNSNYVTFTLKKPISAQASASEIAQELQKYIDQTGQLYYKIFVDLNNDNQWEFITGYADIAGIELVNSNTAKIRLKNIDLGTGKDPQKRDHPFALAAWNYVQSTRQDLLGDNSKGPLEGRARTEDEVLKIFSQAFSSLSPIGGLTKFGNFYKNARNDKWGLKVDYAKSFIRLNSYLTLLEDSTVEKFGGDSRVRSVLIYEDDNSSELIAGQYYDYTDSIVGAGLKMSTGVATNEPTIGGDESALKYGKIGFIEPKFKTSYLQFQEMPVNESYMPSPDVGYSKVTVKSYATEKVMKGILDSHIPTTGVSVHEFYTLKDFPTIFRETELSRNKGTLKYNEPKFAFRPLGGIITESNFAGTQGYYTEINDMHGKEKKISYYGINQEGEVLPTPISYVEYLYKSKDGTDALSNPIKVLDNEVPAINIHLGTITNKMVGLDVENFIDTRSSESKSKSVGGRFNLSVMIFPVGTIPLATLFPDFGYDQRRSYTCVNNKIVHRFGILEKTRVFKEGALTETDNLVYDGFTGSPVLTSVNNEFNDTIYNYTIPAHLIYRYMQPSYSTNNLLFTGRVTNYNSDKKELEITLPDLSDLRQYVNEGDEILIKDNFVNPYSEDDPDDELAGDFYERCFIMQVDNDNKRIWVKTRDGFAPGVTGNTTMYIYRPNNRNQLNGTIGTIVSRHNPLKTVSQQDKCN